MNKNLAYLFVVIALAIAAYFLVSKKPTSTLSVEETAFAVENINDVQKIFMADMKGNQAILERKEKYWVINDKYITRPDAIHILLKTIKNVTIKHPITGKAKNKIIKDLSASHVKVEVYGANNNLLKTYFVGGSTSNNKGTFMIMKDAKNPYVTYIPGFEGYLSTRFFMDEEEWRSRAIFNYSPGKIQSITLDYPASPEHSFIIQRTTDDSLQITALNNRVVKPFNRKLVTEYLSYFKNITAEAFENDYVKKDSFTASVPYCMITVKDANNRENSIKTWLRPVYRRTKAPFDEKGEQIPYDRDRLFALVNNGQDFTLIQWYVFGKILRKRIDFTTPIPR